MAAGPRGVLERIQGLLRRKFPQVGIAEDASGWPASDKKSLGEASSGRLRHSSGDVRRDSGEGTGVSLCLQFTCRSELIMLRSLDCILSRQGSGSELTMLRCLGRLPHLTYSLPLCNVVDETPAYR